MGSRGVAVRPPAEARDESGTDGAELSTGSGVVDRISIWDSSKVVMPGTDRARPPEETLPDALRWAKTVGVTRLADVTRLDTIGIPTYQAVRPNTKTLTVSQGKGMTHELAMISALMESTELWHAENCALQPYQSTIEQNRSALTYDPYRDLPLLTGSFLHDNLPLNWVTAISTIDGAEVPVPLTLVALDQRAPDRWRPQVFYETSNGLASGNTFVEATLHALYEVIERDAITRADSPKGAGVRFDPRDVGSDAIDELLARFEAVDVLVDARWMRSPTGLPCVSVRIVSPDYPRVAGGFGCHLRMDVATLRALTEAAQSRLTLISGARDDLARAGYGVVQHFGPSPRDLDREFDPPPPEILHSTSHGSLREDLAEVSARCQRGFGQAPLVVDLTQADVGAPVVRVLVPGCRMGEDVL
jgi:ribosomal protein S12 methylthiotransferase accessory factor